MSVVLIVVHKEIRKNIISAEWQMMIFSGDSHIHAPTPRP